jgi:uncharacterized membrane protein YfcA
MAWLAAYLSLGAVAGFLGGLFGIGGGTVLVPVLLMLFTAQGFGEQAMHLALGTSMATIIFTALASSRRHHLHGAVDWRVVRRLSPGILFGTLLGGVSVSHAPAHLLKLFFGTFIVLVALQILLDLKPAARRSLPGAGGMAAFGTLTGWLSSLVSIGGGTFVVPFLLWCEVPVRRAIGTSAAVGLPLALGGSLGYWLAGRGEAGLPAYSLGYLYLPALLMLASATVLTAPLGARAVHALPVDLLRKLFAGVLLLLGGKLLLH